MSNSQKLKTSTKIIYGLGDFANQFSWSFVSSYLTVYYTDIVGIAPMVVSALFLIARIWDGINDPMFGMIAERTKSRWGRFRPYILFGSPILALLTFLVFTHPFASNSFKLIWAAATYIGVGMTYTAVNLSYGSLSAVMTYDSKERIELNSWRMIGAFGGTILLGIVAMPLILFFSGNTESASGRGYTLTAAFFAAAIVLPVMLAIFKTSREVIEPDLSAVKIPLKESLRAVIKNKPLMLLFAAMLLYYMGYATHLNMALYYMMYNVRRVDLVSAFMTISPICSIISIYLTKGIIVKVGKKKMTIIGFIGLAVSLFAMWMVNPGNYAAVIALNGVFGCFGYVTTILMGSVPECIDFAEEKYGVRTDGIAFALVSMATKIGFALGPSIGLGLMGLMGYASNQEQTAAGITSINIAVNLLPAVSLLLAVIPMAVYPLNEQKASGIAKRLEAQSAEKRDAPPKGK